MNKKLLCLSIVLIIALALIQQVDARPEQRKIYRSIEEKIDAEGSADVIVRISTQAGQKASRQTIITAQETLKNTREHKIINAYSGELTRKGLKTLKNLEAQGYMIEIYEDRIFYLDATKDNDKKNYKDHDNIGVTSDNSVPSIGANYSHNILNITGRNITIAVIDSGIDYNHSDLGGCFGEGCRVKGGYDLVNNDPDPYDDDGHGTHVAGIIAANGAIIGVAPEAELLAVKACEGNDCALSDVIDAIEWAKDNGADIISMSIGGSYSAYVEGNTGKDSTLLFIEAAINSGKIVVVAAGNEGPGVSTLAVPGAAENVITVGAINDQGTLTQADDEVWSNSGRGPSAFGRLDPDIVAPGVTIYSTLPGNTHSIMSGTSMATPHVSGVAALMLEQNGAMTPAEVRRILMQTSVNITGRVFDVGAGEVNAKNALTYNLSAIIDARNSYGQSVSNDRWEFISPISGTEYANITIYNDNNHAINFTIVLTNFENMENTIKLNNAQFTFPQTIIVPANDEYVIQANFTTNNFSTLYATTYGGKLMLLGNDSKNISVPIVVTVPIKNYANIIRTAYESGSYPYGHPTFPNGNGDAGDVLYYAYYNPKPGNETIRISWDSSSNDLDLYVYNSTADLDVYGGIAGTNYEWNFTVSTDNIKWVRIHAFYFTTPSLNFTLNITDNGNTAPNISSVTNAIGAGNTNFSLSQNITLIFHFEDIDDDTLTITFDDSRYNQESLYSGNVTYTLVNNASLLGNHTVRLTIQDEYGASTYREVIVRVYDTQITSFYPTNLTPVVRKNDTINFSQTSVDPDGNPLNYYWYIDGVLNQTSANLTLDTTELSNDNYNITFRVTNGVTNATQTWNLTIDQYGPELIIVRPNGTINDTIVPIRFNVSDVSGVSACWYNINNSLQNVSISGCTNTTTRLLNGNYTIFMYSNDSFGFIAMTNKTFNVNDTTPPTILSTSPSGSIDYTDRVTLTVVLNENSTCKYGQDDDSYAELNNFFSTTGTTNTKGYNVEGGENVELYVKCADISGNINTQQRLINFTVEEYDGGSGGGGGTGGGSGGGTAPPPTIIPSTSSKYNLFIVEAIDNITLNINSESIALKYAFIKISQAKRSIDMSVIQHDLSAMPSVGNSFNAVNADKKKYAFIEIKHVNLENNEIENAKLRFRVAKSWITENSIDMSSIRIYRYTTSWDELSATIYSQDSTGITYEAISPGLSNFIIAGKSEIQSPTIQPPVNTNEITGDSVLVKKESAEEKPLSITDGGAEEKSDKGLFSPIIIFIVIAVIITIVVADVVIIKKKNAAKTIAKEQQISELKKKYEFEGSQIIQEYSTRLRMIAKDPMIQQKSMQLKQIRDQRIAELHNKYADMMNQVKNSK